MLVREVEGARKARSVEAMIGRFPLLALARVFSTMISVRRVGAREAVRGRVNE
jgi:hypothetical protein